MLRVGGPGVTGRARNVSSLIALRENLLGMSSDNADVDQPFLQVTKQDTKENVLPKLVFALRLALQTQTHRGTGWRGP